MRAIFVSYRRSDSEGEAGRLFDDLVAHFGEQMVFMDVAGIEAGRDFRKAIEESVAGCGVLLCAFACFTVLPALVMLFDRRAFAPEEAVLPLRSTTGAWMPFLMRRPALVIGTGLGATVLLGICALFVKYASTSEWATGKL